MENVKSLNITLNTPISQAGRIFKMYSGRLAKLDIFTLEDLLYHLPFRYDDFSLISGIAQVQPGETVTIQGQVLSMENIYTRNFKKIQKAIVNDMTGSIEAVWYNQQFLTKYIKVNDNISLSGKAELFNNKLVLTSPEYELINNALSSATNSATLHTGRLVPVYPETKGVSSKWLRRQIFKLLQEITDLPDFIPSSVLSKYGYSSLIEALKKVHFPDTLQQSANARERLAFNELLLIQLKSKQRKAEWEKDIRSHKLQVTSYKSQIHNFIRSLPFELTPSQEKSINEVFEDVTKDKPMNRLLQGDVGSGKTIVGTIAMYLAFLNGYQSVLMAPTEILAQQHFDTVKKFTEPFGIKVALATGSKRVGIKNIESGMRKQKYTDKSAPTPDILIGTHAVLHDKIVLEKLGLVIIDEQQRFGVEQRSLIRNKGKNPHFLTMTATPIPRTVALTMYGDLDLSYLSDMPKGRTIIKTWLVPPEKREGAYNWIKKQVMELDSQIFIICPFIEESENMQTVKAATVEYEHLKKAIFPDLKLSLLHGRMKTKEKDEVLTGFRNRKADILVATPVVEVGIDIPNATVILIEAAERFGLAQLHQLRGRVGRGDKQSYCLLFTESPSQHTYTRLKALETKHNGAELAELDLKLRGPGDIFGTAQSGLPKLKVATFSDLDLIRKAKIEADNLYTGLDNFTQLRDKLNEITIKKVSPD